MEKRQAYRPELDGIRAVAILTVMYYHLFAYRTDTWYGEILHWFTRAGWAGVDIFFVLSGYLITSILLATRDSPNYFRSFYMRRALRIFPLYYGVMSALVAAPMVLSWAGLNFQHPSIANIENSWWNFLYLSNFAMAIHGKDYVPLDIAWSLAVEEQFYLVFPFLVYLFRQSTLWKLLVLMIVSAIALRLISAEVFPTGWRAPYVLPFCRMDALAFGGLIAMASALNKTGFLRAMAACAVPAWILVIGFFSVWTRKDTQFIAIGYSLVPLATACTLARLEIGDWNKLRNLLSWGPLVSIGKVSYGLYLLHLIARAGVDATVSASWFTGYQTDLGMACLRFLTISAVALLMAGCSWRFFERPILGLKNRYSARPPTQESPITVRP